MNESSRSKEWPAFLRLWFLLSFAFIIMKLIYDLIAFGWFDLRPLALLQLLLLPLGQSIVFWIITRRRRGAEIAGSQPS